MSDSPVKYFVVDAFTNRPFAGNPAAIVPLPRRRDDVWLQHVAREMNLSETAYLVPNADGYDLRWFTPLTEVDLCGHATIASSVVLAHLGKMADGREVAFSTRSGRLTARRTGTLFQLDFPALPIEQSGPELTSGPAAGLAEALGAVPRFVGRSRFDLLSEVESESVVRSVAPDFRRIGRMPYRGLIVTARSDSPEFDFVSRFFAPALGVDEDPVCGSAHCCLATYWAERLGKAKMVGHQVSTRSGIVHVELRGDRVQLGGEGVIVAAGELLCG
jgi:predicted PhzF superfamily epimerase YddE/YHI9